VCSRIGCGKSAGLAEPNGNEGFRIIPVTAMTWSNTESSSGRGENSRSKNALRNIGE
jgi:hypothetical protein